MASWYCTSCIGEMMVISSCGELHAEVEREFIEAHQLRC